MNFNAGSGGAWGRRGATIDSTGTAWSTTGDGIYDPTSDPPRYGNSIVGVHDRRQRAEAEGLLHADQLGLAAQARSRSEQHPDDLHLQGTRADGGLGQGVPGVPARPEVARRRRITRRRSTRRRSSATRKWTSRTPAAGARCRRGRTRSGTRWVLAPFWGPAHSQAEFPIMNTPLTKDGGVAAFKVEERDGKLQLTPAWISRDMKRGEPVVIANGIVFGVRQRRGNQAGVARHRPAVQFVDPRREGDARDDLCARRADRQGALVERRADAPVEPLRRASPSRTAACTCATYDGTLYCFGLP